MTTHAYSPLYLDKASRNVANMLHDAVEEYGLDGTEFLRYFIQTGIAEQIENGNPKYLAGKSGMELFLEVMEKTTGKIYEIKSIESYERSPVFWAGWLLTHYQWYSNHSFESILNSISYEELLSLYDTLHEADIQKSYEILDSHFQSNESPLKKVRKQTGLTQEELANESGVSVNTIRAYERRSKDLNKAQFNIIIRLTKALKCKVSDLME